MSRQPTAKRYSPDPAHSVVVGIAHSLKGFCLILLILFGFYVNGCSSQRAWLYSREADSVLPTVLDRSVAVPPFSDQRKNENSSWVLLYLVPLMPFGWQNLDAPEGVQMHMTSGIWLWRPNEDLAKATAEDLQASHIFSEVFFTNRASEGDLVFQGVIQSAKYNGKIFSYLLSAYGPLLWFIGFPATHTKNQLEISFSLKERNTGKVLWESSYQSERSGVSWIYYLQSDFNYSELYKEIMLKAVKDLRAKLGSKSSKGLR